MADVPRTDWGLEVTEKDIKMLCCRPVLLYCSKTWDLTVADEVWMRRTECQVTRVICKAC